MSIERLRMNWVRETLELSRPSDYAVIVGCLFARRFTHSEIPRYQLECLVTHIAVSPVFLFILTLPANGFIWLESLAVLVLGAIVTEKV